MGKRIKLPLPPRIDAVARLDDLEDMAEAFRHTNGYNPELLSHWDPKPSFGQEIQTWVTRQKSSSSLVEYVYSSYLEIDDRIRQRLGEKIDRGIVLTSSGTTSIATVVTYLSNIKIDHLHIVTPAYFAVESLASSFGLQFSFHDITRSNGRYELPKISVTNGFNAIWLTLPIYGASSYIASSKIASFIDALPSRTIVVVDESLSFPDRASLSSTRTRERVIRIITPHKALCLNGEKVSFITVPEHLSDGISAWSECLVGGIGASGQAALQFLATEAFDGAAAKARRLIQARLERMKYVLGSRETVSLDNECDGHFAMLYWPSLPMALSDSQEFLKGILDVSGAMLIPASRNRHPPCDGFAFRVNLFRLDDAGLGGLKRLADALDQCAR